jgi:hypothetical protein
MVGAWKPLSNSRLAMSRVFHSIGLFLPAGIRHKLVHAVFLMLDVVVVFHPGHDVVGVDDGVLDALRNPSAPSIMI